MKVFNIRFVLMSVGFAAVTSACGPMNQVSGSSAPFLSNHSTSNSVSSSAGTTLEQKCAAMPNVAGTGFSNTIDREYRVCRASQVGGAASQIALFPEDQSQKQVCVFPIQVVNGVPSVIITNPYASATQRFAVQCGIVQGSGAMMNFGSLQFQGAYIVSYNDAYAFSNCLATGSVSYCAAAANIPYSVGYWQ